MGRGEMTRRDFLKNTSLMTLLNYGSTQRLFSFQKQTDKVVNFGIIGTGEYGRQLLSFLIKVPGVCVTALCDIYEPHLRMAQEIIGQKVVCYQDHRTLLDDEKIQAVIIATPPHTHKDIALDSLQAEKHVWCEVPLATTIDDAKAIAKAVVNTKTVFQIGLQKRYNPTYNHAVNFMHTGAIGKPTVAHGQRHQKDSWRRPVRDKSLERQLNWKLYWQTSGGLLTEIALHQFDVARWFLGSTPTSVQAWGNILLWQDGREIPDTVQCILNFPNGVQMFYRATLTNSFQDNFDYFAGEFGTIYLSGLKGILFKEADAPSLGWEVYAKRERFLKDEGYLLIANATKLIEEGKLPSEVGMKETLENQEIFVALNKFLESILNGNSPIADAQKGLEATVVALKAVEALQTGTIQSINASDFQI